MIICKHYAFSLRIQGNGYTIIDATIGASDDPDSIAKAKEAIQEMLNEYTPTIKPLEPPTTPGIIVADEHGPAPTASTWEYLIQRTAAQKRERQAEAEAEPEPEPESAAPATPKKLDGAKGLLRLHCPECGKTFGTYLKERQSAVTCRCGHRIDLTGTLARYRFTCPYCEKESWGFTNLEDPDITIRCKCGGDVDLRWNAKAKEYQN